MKKNMSMGMIGLVLVTGFIGIGNTYVWAASSEVNKSNLGTGKVSKLHSIHKAIDTSGFSKVFRKITIKSDTPNVQIVEGNTSQMKAQLKGKAAAEHAKKFDIQLAEKKRYNRIKRNRTKKRWCNNGGFKPDN